MKLSAELHRPALVLALAFLIAVAWASTATAATIPVVPGAGNPIQAAIDAASPGDTIEVAAGTYTVGGVLVTKSITLRGANAGKTGVDPARGPESKIVGGPSANMYLVQLRAANVVFDGFEVTNPSYDGGSLNQDPSLIVAGWSGLGSTASGIRVLNNRVHDLANGWAMTGGGAITGINVAPCDGPTIRGNYVYDLSARGGAANVVGIITWGNNAGDTVRDAIIDGNVVEDITYTGVDPDGLARGINVGYGSASASVSNNVVSVSQIGILMTGAPVPGTVLVEGNTIDGMSVAGIVVRSGSPNPVTMENNLVTAPIGVRVGTGATSVTLANNSLAGSPVGLESQAVASISAIDNWWGQASGPLGGQVVGSATTTPWITAYTDDSAKAGAPGFWPLAPTTPPTVSTPASSAWSLVALALAAGVVVYRRRRALNA